MVRNLFHRRRKHEPGAGPEELWVRCEKCRELVYVREFEKNLKVCQRCGFHHRLTAMERISVILDEDSFQEEDQDLEPADPLDFVSLDQTYRGKLAETQSKSGLREAVICGRGLIEGSPARVAVCDFSFLGASMGSVLGEKVARASERSAADGLPLVAISASGGARMHEGIFSLMQMAKTAGALERLGRTRVPYISVLTDPTTGGVTASFASLGDTIIAETGALIGFAGPRVIEQITKQKLPPGAQSAEFLLEHGMVDMVVHRRELRPALGRLLRLYSQRRGVQGGRRDHKP